MPAAGTQNPKELVDHGLKVLALCRAYPQQPEAAAGRGQRGNADEVRRLLDELQRRHAEIKRWTSQARNAPKGKVEQIKVRIETEIKRFQEMERTIQKAEAVLIRSAVKECNREEADDGSGEGAVGENSEVKVQADQLVRDAIEDQDMVDEFICKICQVHIVGRGPKLARCSHLFCGDCIATWFAAHPSNTTWAQRAQGAGSVPCPVCKEPLNKDTDLFSVSATGPAESAFLWQMLSSLQVVCTNHPQCRADGKCTWAGPYGAFQQHVQSCGNGGAESTSVRVEAAAVEPQLAADVEEGEALEEEVVLCGAGDGQSLVSPELSVDARDDHQGSETEEPGGDLREQCSPVDQPVEIPPEVPGAGVAEQGPPSSQEMRPSQPVVAQVAPAGSPVEAEDASLTDLIRSLMQLKAKDPAQGGAHAEDAATQQPAPAQPAPALPAPAQQVFQQPAAPPPEQGVVMRVLYPFVTAEVSQLALGCTDLVEVLEKHSSGWMYGRKVHAAVSPAEGWFPAWAVIQ